MKTKRIISILLTLCMLLALLPTAAIPARAAWFGAGDGTAENPYQIGTAAELAEFRGSVNGNDKQNVGGVVGLNNGTVQNASFSGPVIGKDDIGGVVGENMGGKVENCYNTGAVTVSSGSAVGGVVGDNFDGYNMITGSVPPIVTGCYYLTGNDTTFHGIGYSSGTGTETTTGLSTDDFKKQSSFPGWDFTNTWYMGGDAPELRAFIKHVSTWTDLKAALQAGGAIVLTADVKPDDAYWDDALTVPSGVTATLDLNGHIVDRGYTDASTQLWDGSVIKISGTLTLLDSDPTAAHDPEFTYTDPITERAMTVNGGVITGGHPDQYGGGVQVLGGTFDMKGGSIACNSTGKNAFGAEAALGGGVYMQSGTFNMSGGAIVGNKTSNKNTMMPDTPLGKGGAVFIAGGTFTLSGGLIRGNCAGDDGGAVYVDMNGTFAMTGGIIVGNISNRYNNQVSNVDGGSAPNMVTSFLHSNDGNDYTSEQTFPSTVDTTIATDVFVRDGYEFKGWAISANSNVTLADGAAFSASGDGHLWAKWQALNYTVAVTPGENMTKTTSSGAVSQTVSVGSAMTAVVYTANDGYYFPENYSVDAVNGVTVTRDSFTQITVSGTPTADAAITLTATTAKNKEQTPTAIFTATGADTGTLSNVAAGMKYKIDNGEWQTISGTSVDLTDLAPCTITIYMPGNGTTTVDSDAQTITVTKAATPNLAVTQPAAIGARGVVETTDVHEWSSNTYDWEDCFVSQDWPQNCTIFIRVKASGTVLASDYQTVTINAFVPTQEPVPSAVFTATGADTGTLSNFAAGMKYKIDNGEWQTISGTSVDLTNLAPCTITVYMPSNGTTTIDSDEQTITVTKAAAPALTANQPTTIGGTGSIPTTTEHQKSADDTAWEDCTGEWTGLTEGTYYVRVKANGAVLASEPQNIEITAFVPAQEQTPEAIFTATGADTGTLSNLAAGMKYKIDNDEWQTVSATSVDLTNLAPCTITIYMPGNGTTTVDSDEQTITVTKAATPTLTATHPAVINGTGSIPTATAHQKSTNGTDWTDCTGAWENLEANKTYYVRVKAAGMVLASDAQTIKINAFVPGQEQQPQAIFTATGVDTGTLSNVAAGTKYKIDNGEWQTISGTSVDLTNLAPCTITIYMPGNGTTTVDSDEQTITVTKAATPTLEATQPATINDKGVIPTTTAHEKSVNGTDWKECDGMWTDLDEGTYYVRVKAAGTALVSDAQEIVIAVARYTVKFVDEDGTELQSTVYACGETPVYNGEEPTKEATAENTYTFAGWTPEIVPVAEDTTYTARYDATVNEYTVTFESNGGSDVPVVKVKYGEPVAEPDAPEKKSFAFAGWFADEGLETPYDFMAKITSDTKIYAKWTPIRYPMFSGENSEWTKGGNKDVVITVKRSDADETCLAHFIGVEIDGNPLEKDVDYTAAKGSVVITLKAATIEKLSVGEHTLAVIFDDGRVETKLTIKAAPNNDPVSPQTGDNSHIELWIILMIISFCGLSATLVIGKKKRISGR